ncbi:MAG: hypothetical protein J6L69_01080 [Lachnospiraceae bacterium]|nr:hypothetical protein [Lachnospiraceae bacterium]
MRKYKDKETNQLSKVFCNRCGKKMKVKDGIIMEGNFSIEYNWGFFSNKDCERHIIDLCEDCYDEMVREFKVPVDIEQNVELL